MTATLPAHLLSGDQPWALRATTGSPSGWQQPPEQQSLALLKWKAMEQAPLTLPGNPAARAGPSSAASGSIQGRAFVWAAVPTEELSEPARAREPRHARWPGQSAAPLPAASLATGGLTRSAHTDSRHRLRRWAVPPGRKNVPNHTVSPPLFWNKNTPRG